MVVGWYRVGVGPLWPACIYLRGNLSSSNTPPHTHTSCFLDPSIPFCKHCFKVFDKHWQWNSRTSQSSVLFSPPTPSSSVCPSVFSHLPSLPCTPFRFLSDVIWKEYIVLNNWTCPSFCSSLNNAIAGFIGDHYSNCLIIASTLALAAAHSLSAYRPSHRLCDAQQCVTLDREAGRSLSLSLWPAWHHYSILAHGERGGKKISLFLSLSTTCLIFSYMPHSPCHFIF